VTCDYNMRDGAPRKVMDDRRFRKVFPNFQFTPLNEGVAATMKYYSSVFPY
jgi:GDP-L-fucose synthase